MERFGVGRVFINPFVEGLPYPISEADGVELTSRGVPLSKQARQVRFRTMSLCRMGRISFAMALYFRNQEKTCSAIEELSTFGRSQSSS